MRKPAIIVIAVICGIIVAIAAILIYASANLNSLIAENRDRLLSRVSHSLGRSVEVKGIKAEIGWGITADLYGVEIGDDPAFSVKPFLTASNVYARVELMPLLARQLRISKIVLEQPEITIIRKADGALNVTTLGRRREHPSAEGAAAGAPAKSPPGSASGGGANPMEAAPRGEIRHAARLEALHVKNFSISSGEITYRDANQPPVKIGGIDFDLANFSFTSPFLVDLKMAALNTGVQNFELNGTVGPLIKDGILDVNAVPLGLKLAVGPISIADLRKFDQRHKTIPQKLEISDTVSADASIKGSVGAAQVHLSTDLTSNRVTFGGDFVKPVGVLFKIEADAEREGSRISFKVARLTIGALDLKATRIAFGGGNFSGRLDSNRFDIASLTNLSPRAAKFNVGGNAEIHADAQVVNRTPIINGVVTLAGVKIPKPGSPTGAASMISNLSGPIRFTGSAADIGPLTFSIGASNASLKAHAAPLFPPVVSYTLTADAIHTADLMPGRPADELLNKVAASGTVERKAFGIDDENKLTSASGMLNNAAYSDLNLATSLEGRRIRILNGQVKAFGGQIVATAETQLAPDAPFSTSLSFANVNLQQALASQKLKVADKVQGLVTGNIGVSGRIGKFADIKSTLSGNGRVQLAQGKLVGINVAAIGLKKVDKLPGIGDLIPASVIRNHPELFQSPDTDIRLASLSFVLKGPRITTHDLTVQTPDYSLTGDGWFDLDKNIAMASHLLLSPDLTKEIVAQKPAVVYVTNRSNQIDIPVMITGQLPKPTVVPDVSDLAQRASRRAIEQTGTRALGKLLGKKGLGGILGGGGNNSGDTSGQNPLKNLKKLF